MARGQGGGPKTPKGKAIVRTNALRHGATSAAPVIPGESPAAWNAHQAAISSELGASGRIEEALAQRVAMSLWRLDRLTRYEAETLRASIGQVEADIAAKREARHGPANYDSVFGERVYDKADGQFKPSYKFASMQSLRAQIAETRASIQFFEALPAMPADALVQNAPDFLTIFEGHVSRGYGDRWQAVAYTCLPGYDADIEIFDYYDIDLLWTVDILRQCFALVVDHAATTCGSPDSDTVTVYLEGIVSDQQRDLRDLEKELAELEEVAERMRHSRILNDDLQTRMERYESAALRSMRGALHDLNQIQDRRAQRFEPKQANFRVIDQGEE